MAQLRRPRASSATQTLLCRGLAHHSFLLPVVCSVQSVVGQKVRRAPKVAPTIGPPSYSIVPPLDPIITLLYHSCTPKLPPAICQRSVLPVEVCLEMFFWTFLQIVRHAPKDDPLPPPSIVCTGKHCGNFFDCLLACWFVCWFACLLASLLVCLFACLFTYLLACLIACWQFEDSTPGFSIMGRKSPCVSFFLAERSHNFFSCWATLA